jgi:hypothetical protein
MNSNANLIAWLPDRSGWELVAAGKHSLIYNCGDGWVFKQARCHEQTVVREALKMLYDLADVPRMIDAVGGFFQEFVRGVVPSPRETMRLAWRINQISKSRGIYFYDLVPGNVIMANGRLVIIDALWKPRRR